MRESFRIETQEMGIDVCDVNAWKIIYEISESFYLLSLKMQFLS